MSAHVILNPFMMSELNRFQPRSRPRPLCKIDPGKSFVRRSLFGPVDHEENKSLCKVEYGKLIQEENRRWNFDFESETPMDGQFTWERIDADVPQSYECSRLSLVKDTQENVESSRHVVSNPSVIKSEARVPPCTLSTMDSDCCDMDSKENIDTSLPSTLVTGEYHLLSKAITKSKLQPKITGFMRRRKRGLSDDQKLQVDAVCGKLRRVPLNSSTTISS